MNSDGLPKTDQNRTLPPAEQRRAALEYRFQGWVPGSLSSHLDDMAERYSDQPLLIIDNRQFTYRNMADWSQALARGLVSLGIKRGDNVALLMANYPEFVALKFAIARIGAVAVPINFLLRANELDYIFRQSDARALITMAAFGDRDYLTDLEALMPGWAGNGGGNDFPLLKHVIVFPGEGDVPDGAKSVDDLSRLGGSADESRMREYEALTTGRDNADIIYTSGTTGSPKGVMLEHHMVLRAAYASAYTCAFEEGRRLLFSLPMYHVFGYVECLIGSMFVGGAIIPRLTFDPDDMISAAERHAANEIICVPLMTQKLIEVVKERGFNNSAFTTMFNSGGATPPSMWPDIRNVLGAQEILTAYGMSETTASTTCTHPEADDKYLLTTNGKLKYAGVAGDPALKGLLAVYRTMDPETGDVLPWNEAGELIVKGPIVTRGYYNKPDETRETFTADGWLRTGDIGTVSEDGYVKLTGRIKETYRCGGEMVMPSEVENVLNTHPHVSQSHVLGVADSKMGEVGCACVIRSADTEVSEEELINYCRMNLARFKVPKLVLFVEEGNIPMTATGRVQKFKLADWAIEQLAHTQD